MRNTVFIALALIGLNGCYIGPATYEVFEKNRNISIGDKIYPGLKNKKQPYTEEFDIYPVEYIKGCVFGHITRKNDKTIIDWTILYGKEYCKEQQAYGF